MAKTLVFISDKSRVFFPYAQSDKVHIENVWNENRRNKWKFLIRIIRKLHIVTGFFFDEWTKDIQNYSQIIIFDGCYDKLLMYYLNRKNPAAPKNVFCWNAKYRLVHVLSNTSYPVYSYSPRDCQVCEMQYMSTVYSKRVRLPQLPLRYDLVFLGMLKDRGDQIADVYDWCVEHGYNPEFYVVGKKAQYRNIPLKQKQLNYEEYLQMVSQSRAILDISNPGQDGLTMRVMEALFFHKKLITTNEDIVNYDFYRPENICVLNILNINIPEEFFKIDYIDIPEETLNGYDMDSWVDKFKEKNGN